MTNIKEEKFSTETLARFYTKAYKTGRQIQNRPSVDFKWTDTEYGPMPNDFVHNWQLKPKITKVSELTGEELSYWVAKAQGWQVLDEHNWFRPSYESGILKAWYLQYTVSNYRPDKDQKQALVLMKELEISLRYDGKIFTAEIRLFELYQEGLTLEEAISRAFLAWHLEHNVAFKEETKKCLKQ